MGFPLADSVEHRDANRHCKDKSEARNSREANHCLAILESDHAAHRDEHAQDRADINDESNSVVH